MRKIFFFFLLFTFLFSSDVLEELTLRKVKYALNCNAKYTSITEVELLDVKEVSSEKHLYKIYGAYKSVLSASFHFKGIGIGDEFHPISGSFVGLIKVKEHDIDLKELFYKISFKKGKVNKKCLLGGN
jgi:hypothetical protein